MSRFFLVFLAGFILSFAGGFSPLKANGDTPRFFKPVKTTGYTFAVWSDMHYSVALPNRCGAVLEFLAEYEPKPTFLMVTGDIGMFSTYYADGDTLDNVWQSVRTLTTWSKSSGISLVPILGNHEPSYEFTESEEEAFVGMPYPQVPDSVRTSHSETWDPYRLARKAWSSYFKNEDYYSKDFHSISVMAMSNNVDTLFNTTNTPSPTANYVRLAYPIMNPPGIQDTCSLGDLDCYAKILAHNADHSGFVTPGSDQWEWANDHLESSSAIWNIVGFHRSVYAPHGPTSYGDPGFDVYVQRPNIYSARWGIIPDLIDRGAKLFFQGDVHQGAVVGPVYKGSVDPQGAYFVTTHAGYSTRVLKTAYVPDNSLLYPDPVPEEKQTGAHFAVCHVFGKRIHLKIYHFESCDDPEPSLVFEKGIRL